MPNPIPTQVFTFTATIPAGTPQGAPATTNLPLPDGDVTLIEALVPPGPNGLMSFRFTSGGLQMIPYGQGTFVTANDENLHWALAGQISSGAWQLQGFNAGAYDHSIYLRFHVVTTGTLAAPAPVVPLEAAVLNQQPADAPDITADDTGADVPPELAVMS